FNIERKPNSHVAFGVGIHYCLGAILAETEVEIVLATMMARLPSLKLATQEIRWKPSHLLRQLERLSVEY
ncbi:MAG: cytochrome P450, partial [Planctomycetota bacterium]|nr:cytochrome P450 [Planctomycetota bacterium]